MVIVLLGMRCGAAGQVAWVSRVMYQTVIQYAVNGSTFNELRAYEANTVWNLTCKRAHVLDDGLGAAQYG